MRGLFLIASLCLYVPLANADKPVWAGGGKHDKGERVERMEGGEKTDHYGRHDAAHSRDIAPHGYFDSDMRRVVQQYYHDQFKGGKCPPGLAKKNNGCLPPGQAKKWRIGHPLGGLESHRLPGDLLRRLGNPPSGYRYVRVASDILLIAIGTGMVIDAIEDLGRM